MSSDRLPLPLKDVVERLAGLPGLGPKSALRAALAILKWPDDRARGLGQAIFDLRDRLHVCGRCASLAESDPCPICADPARTGDLLCVVSEWDSLLVLEEAGFYKGRYLVLGGLLAPLDGLTEAHLELGRLRARLREGESRVGGLARAGTLPAEATASFLKNLVEREFPGVVVSRLAQGIPLGAEVKYMDKETLRQSLAHRQRL